MIRILMPVIPVSRRLPSVVAGMALYTVAIYLALQFLPIKLVDVSGYEMTMLSGLVVGLLMSFRNNEAAKRWWEGRQLWGQLINESRTWP